MPRLYEIDPVEYLVRHKFPHLGGMRAAGILARDGRPVTADKVKEIEAEAEQYRQKLRAISSEELERLVDEVKSITGKELEEKRAAKEASIWFNSPFYRPEFSRWAGLSFWTLEEAIMLSLERDPDKVTAKSITSFSNSCNLSEQLTYRLKLAQRAKALEKMFDPVLPPFFVRWAQGCGMILPVELIESVEAAHGVHHNWEDEAKRLAGIITELQGKLETVLVENSNLRTRPESKPGGLNQRERTSLMKLVAGMAVGGYAFDPKATRSHAAKEIADDLRLNGIPLDEDTVRKYLQEAKVVLKEHETE